VSKKNRSKSSPSTPENEAPAPQGRPPAGRRPPAPATAVVDGLAWLDDLPAIGLAVLCVFLPVYVMPGIRDLFQLPKQLLMAEMAVLLVALLAALAWGGRPLRWPQTPLLWPALALAASVAMGVAIAPDETGGVLTLFARMDAHRWAAAGLLFAVALVAIRSPRALGYLAAGLLIGGVWVALIGIGEQHDIDWLRPTQRWPIISKPGSTFGNRNMAAQLIVSVMPAGYMLLAMAARWWGQGRRWLALIAGSISNLSLLILLYYLVLTVTRSAWVGASMGLIVSAVAWTAGLWLFRFRAQRAARATEVQATRAGIQEVQTSTDQPHGLLGARARTLLLPLAIVLAVNASVALMAVVVVKPTAARIDEGDAKRGESVHGLVMSLFDFEQNAAKWRFGMWASTWEAIKAHPFGRGAGNWRVLYPQFVTQKEKNEMFTIAKQPTRAHQDFLQFGSEFGLQGLLALLALVGAAFWLTIRVVARAANPTASHPHGAAWLAFGSMASMSALIAICGDALLSFPLQLPAPTFLFALHLAVIGSSDAWLGRRDHPETVSRPAPTPMAVKVGLTVFALLGIAFLGPKFAMFQDTRVWFTQLRTEPIESVQTWGKLHERWMVAELGFTDGRALQKKGRADAGLEAIRRATTLNPDDFQNHFIEGLNLNSLRHTQEAIKSIEKSLLVYPNLLNAWVNLAMFNARIRDFPAMDRAIDRALALKPDELVVLNVRATRLAEAGKYAQLLALMGPQVEAYAKYRGAPPTQAELAHGSPHWPPPVSDWPKDEGANQLLGAYTQALGHAAKAARQLQKWPKAALYLQWLALEDPNNADTVAGLAEALDKDGRLADALPKYRLAAELSRRERPDFKRTYAIALARTGDFDQAAHETREALRIAIAERPPLLEELKRLQAGQPAQAARYAELIAMVTAFPNRPAPVAAPTPAAAPTAAAPAVSPVK
jgi:tetratricopeptide (TPR) repeat protein/O-antigen ligase